MDCIVSIVTSIERDMQIAVTGGRPSSLQVAIDG